MAMQEIDETTLSNGARVILETGRYKDDFSNPRWDGEHGRVVGTVVEVHSSLFNSCVSVRWDNEYSNRYESRDLTIYKNDPTPIVFKGKAGIIVHRFKAHYIINFEEDMKGFSCDGRYKKGSCLIVQKIETEEVKK